MNNCSIPSMHAVRKTNNLSVKHFLALYPSLSPYGQTELRTEGQINYGGAGYPMFPPG
jgi:hypothetical protein